MSEELDAATVLEEAADLLLIHGRGPFERRDEMGRYCVVGAISQVRYADPHHLCSVTPEIKALAEKVESYRPTPLSTVMRWSDATSDDFEVIDTLRHVAKDLRNEARA